MQKRQKLTNSSDEASISDLLSGDIVFSSPIFNDRIAGSRKDSRN